MNSPDAPLQTHQWSRTQYENMIETGVLTEKDRVELLDGRIVTMSPQNSQHVTAVTICRDALTAANPEGYFVRTQAPIALGSHSEPIPDLALVEGTPADYWDAHPQRAELIVEVADSSLQKDRATKRHLYATHEIPEYWILNLVAANVEVYRAPTGGDYGTKMTISRDDEIRLSSVACDPISVSALIPE